MQNALPSLLGRPIFRFAGVGLLSTVLDLAVLNLSRQAGLPPLQATALGFLVGATNGYLLNSGLVFDRRRSYAGYARYFLVSLGGFFLTELIVYFLNVRSGWLTLNLTKLVAVGAVFFWNYSLSKAWAFR